MPFFNRGIGVLPNTSFPHFLDNLQKNAIFMISIEGAETATAGTASGCLDFFMPIQIF